MKVLIIGICLIMSCFCGAQSTNDCIDIVYLKNGSKFIGTLKEVKIGEYLILQSINGIELRVEERFIKKIIQQCKGKSITEKDNSIFNEGSFISVRSQFAPGVSYDEHFQIGLGSQLAAGYRLNSKMGVGLSLGYEKFNLVGDEDQPLIPVMAEISGLISNKVNSPSYNIGFGYAFANSDNNYPSNYRTILDYNGGLSYHGLIGLRLSNHMRMNVGVRFQHIVKYWKYGWADNSTFNKDNIVNKRLILGIEYIW